MKIWFQFFSFATEKREQIVFVCYNKQPMDSELQLAAHDL